MGVCVSNAVSFLFLNVFIRQILITFRDSWKMLLCVSHAYTYNIFGTVN